MCTKNKTSFGCGHCVKSIVPCHIPDCQVLEKWRFPKPGDCPECKAAGETLTRGKDGRGRYAREHAREQARQRESRQSSADDYIPMTESSSAVHMAISPWAPKTPKASQEKPWSTPTRQKADEAWLIEHERRMSDLEEKTGKMSLQSRGRNSRKASPRESYERDLEVTEIFEEPEDIGILPPQSKPGKLLPYEVEEVSRTNSHRARRKHSHDSEPTMLRRQEAMPLKTPPRKTHFVPPSSEYNPRDYRDVHRKPRRPGPRTEPYISQPCFYDIPIMGNPLAHGNVYYQHETVQPVYRDPYYPRSGQVH